MSSEAPPLGYRASEMFSTHFWSQASKSWRLPWEDKEKTTGAEEISTVGSGPLLGLKGTRAKKPFYGKYLICETNGTKND